jgi:hypothetical protein
MVDLPRVIGFEWDEGNSRKNEQHGVSMAEAEQVFFNSPLLVLPDPRHSEAEQRFHAVDTRWLSHAELAKAGGRGGGFCSISSSEPVATPGGI